MNRPTESQIQSAIIDYLRMVGAVVTRVNSGKMFVQNSNGSSRIVRLADAGTADLIACYRGRYLAIEVKDHKGKVRPEQEQFIQEVNDAEGRGFIARSVDDVIKVLDQIKSEEQ